MLKISRMRRVMVPVEVMNLEWSVGPGPESVANLKCGACRNPIGGVNKFAVAWIREGEKERSMRLCSKCARNAEVA